MMSSRQLSFLITLFSMGIVLSSLFIIKLKGERAAEDVYEVVLEEEPEITPEEELAETQPTETSERIRNQRLFNEDLTDPIEPPEPLKSAEEVLNELKEDQGEDTPGEDAYSEYLKQLAEQRKRKAQELEEKNRKEEPEKDIPAYSKDRNTSAYFSLVDRRPLGDRLPLPIYTCIRGGKVVVNITVNADGYVTDARYNAKSSSTSNGCLVDNALEYARRARFSSSNRSEQLGTITYLFEGKQ